MLLPFRTDRPRIRPAYLTVTLIAVNVLVFIYDLFLPPVLVPVMYEGRRYLLEGARLFRGYGLRGNDPAGPRFLSPLFIHAGPLHLIGNMLFLWIFGSLIEDALRPWGLL